jgi:hypothetical protein
MMSPTAATESPVATTILEPIRSTSLALSGETTIITPAIGSSRTPASSGV